MKTLKLDCFIIILKNKRKHTVYFLILPTSQLKMNIWLSSLNNWSYHFSWKTRC